MPSLLLWFLVQTLLLRTMTTILLQGAADPPSTGQEGPITGQITGEVTSCSRAALRTISTSVHPSVSLGGFYPDLGSPDGAPIRDPSLRLPLDSHTEGGFGAWLPPPRGARPDGAPLSLAPLPRSPYQEEEEEEELSWRPAPPFPPFPDRSRGGAPRRLYERKAPPSRRSRPQRTN